MTGPLALSDEKRIEMITASYAMDVANDVQPENMYVNDSSESRRNVRVPPDKRALPEENILEKH